jgi:hypothetical protein
MSTSRRALFAAGSAILSAATFLAAGPARADEGLPLHHVKYTLTAENPIWAQIYYLDHEPAVWADWSHNPFEFMPNIEQDLGPGITWTYELDLQKPQEWAMVIANTGPEPSTPNFHCAIAVDGTTVVSNVGGKGVLCSIRKW